ncbi:hypothetical protein HY440_01510 [Candidatus Microgenomates bacterium]|nr:hypothetical protein [Candidatus Microgenomates bacterium]
MQKVIKTGHSLALTIPTKFAKALAVKKGDQVKVEKRIDKGSLTYFFAGIQQLPISDTIFRKK